MRKRKRDGFRKKEKKARPRKTLRENNVLHVFRKREVSFGEQSEKKSIITVLRVCKGQSLSLH